MDRHFAGIFNVGNEEITGELIYNKENGVILLNLEKRLIDDPMGKTYPDFDVITGVLNSGATVTLYNNRRTKSYVKAFQSQQIVFVAEYLIWSKRGAINNKYNRLVCVLENALEWSGLTSIDTSNFSAIKFKNDINENVYHWFGSKIKFSTLLNCELFNKPHKEESKVIERLVVSIESDEKQDISYFITIRNKLISLISFAIRNNVNVEEQYLHDFDDSYQIGEHIEYYNYYLYTSESRLTIHNSRRHDYNFTLSQLLPEKDIEKELALLEPVFNLYLSLFKYTDMPSEMVFLNIVQALETFHARFFYGDSKENYVASVMERFGNWENFSSIEKLLLCDTQKDQNCKYIILISRLNDLLIGEYNGLFWDYYMTNDKFAQTVADTRHYYTHYGKSKEKKALKGDELIDAIGVLALLLEYNVCLQLGIDNQTKVRESLSEIATWKQIQNYFQKENNQK